MQTVYVAAVVKAHTHDWVEINEEVFSDFNSALSYLYDVESRWLSDKKTELDYSYEEMDKWVSMALGNESIIPGESYLKNYVFNGSEEITFSISKKEIDNII